MSKMVNLTQEEIDMLSSFVEENLDEAGHYSRPSLVEVLRKLPDIEYGAGELPEGVEGR